jgi:hypothetical protein
MGVGEKGGGSTDLGSNPFLVMFREVRSESWGAFVEKGFASTATSKIEILHQKK